MNKQLANRVIRADEEDAAILARIDPLATHEEARRAAVKRLYAKHGLAEPVWNQVDGREVS